MKTILLKYSADEVLDLENASFEKKEKIIGLFSQFLDTLDQTTISVISAHATSIQSPTIKICKWAEYLSHSGISDFLFLDMEEYLNLSTWIIIGNSEMVSESRLLGVIHRSKNKASLWTRLFLYIFKRDLFYDFQEEWISDLLDDNMLVLTKDSDAEGLLIYYQADAVLDNLKAVFEGYCFKLPFSKSDVSTNRSKDGVLGNVSDFKTKLAADLRVVLVEPDRLMEVWRKHETHLAALPIRHNLAHFFSDADIRAEIPAYAVMQTEELEKFIRLLEADAEWDVLCRISFLQPSS